MAGVRAEPLTEPTNDGASFRNGLLFDLEGIDLSQARLRVVRWDSDRPVEVHAARIEGPRDAATPAGWSFPVAIPIDLSGARHSLEIDNVLLHGDNFWHAARLTAQTADA